MIISWYRKSMRATIKVKKTIFSECLSHGNNQFHTDLKQFSFLLLFSIESKVTTSKSVTSSFTAINNKEVLFSNAWRASCKLLWNGLFSWSIHTNTFVYNILAIMSNSEETLQFLNWSKTMVVLFSISMAMHSLSNLLFDKSRTRTWHNDWISYQFEFCAESSKLSRNIFRVKLFV